MLFEVWREKQYFFGAQWKPHRLVLEHLSDIDLWQVEIKSHENEAGGGKPEEIFLLSSVEQCLVGNDDRFKQATQTATRSSSFRNNTIKRQATFAAALAQAADKSDKFSRFVKFTFKNVSSPIFVLFEDSHDYEIFMQKVKLIVSNKWNTEPAVFVMEQNTLDDNQSYKLKNPRFVWLQDQQSSLIDKISSAMRKNCSSFGLVKETSIIGQKHDETTVDWMAPVAGTGPRIRYKVMLFIG